MSVFAALRKDVGDPDGDLTYPGTLRGLGSPARALFAALIALSAYVMVVPMVATSLLVVFGWLSGAADQAAFLADARAYKLPLGLVAGHIGLSMLIPISFGVYYFGHHMRSRWLFSVQPGMRWRYLIGALVIALITLNATMWVSMMGKPLPFTGPEPGWVWFLAAIVCCAPLQAAGEEIFFRGYLMQAFGSVSANKWLPVVLSALLFAFFHGTQNLALFCDRFAFGLLAGALVVLTGGIEAGIAAHVINNVFAFGYAVFSGGVAQARALTTLTWRDAAFDIAGFALFGALAWLLAKKMNLATTTPR